MQSSWRYAVSGLEITPAGAGGPEPLNAGDLAQVRQIEAMGVVMVRLLFGGYDPYSVFSFVSPGRTGDPFTSR
jgi:8-hydroxy-5-deazaflavin:NADPH oxidoreductase